MARNASGRFTSTGGCLQDNPKSDSRVLVEELKKQMGGYAETGEIHATDRPSRPEDQLAYERARMEKEIACMQEVIIDLKLELLDVYRLLKQGQTRY